VRKEGIVSQIQGMYNLLESLEAAGYRGFLVAELGFGYSVDPDLAVRKTIDRLRQLVRR